MRRTSPSTSRCTAAALALSLLAGCATLLGVNREPPRLYLLNAESPASPATTTAANPSLGLGPVDLPGYLDRQGIVTRVGPNRLETSHNDLWAESVVGNFKDVLAEDLRLRLPGTTIRPLPWSPSTRPALSVAVDVSRFEATSSGTAELYALWTLRETEQQTVVGSHEARISQPIASGGTEAAVAALGQAVAALSDEIAAEVARHTSAPPPARRRTS